jgi:hypothetical protein
MGKKQRVEDKASPKQRGKKSVLDKLVDTPSPAARSSAIPSSKKRGGSRGLEASDGKKVKSMKSSESSKSESGDSDSSDSDPALTNWLSELNDQQEAADSSFPDRAVGPWGSLAVFPYGKGGKVAGAVGKGQANPKGKGKAEPRPKSCCLPVRGGTPGIPRPAKNEGGSSSSCMSRDYERPYTEKAEQPQDETDEESEDAIEEVTDLRQEIEEID